MSPPLRIAVLADFEGPHARRWLRYFVEQGHEVHAISFYRPRADLPGVILHVLRDLAAPSAGEADDASAARGVANRLPTTALRLAHAARYHRSGLRRTLKSINPDVFHAHYLVEHGFYGSLAGFHPYVVSGWGSDVFIEAQKPPGRLLAKWALARADLATANDPAMAAAIADLGAAAKVEVVRLGVDDAFLSEQPASLNLLPFRPSQPVVVSDRALEPLYNVDAVIRAFSRARTFVPDARLIVAHDGGERQRLQTLAASLGDAVSFVGRLTPSELREMLAQAQVYVSVPDSDSMAVSTLEAMAAGCFPVVSDLPSQRSLIEHGVNGLLVPLDDDAALAEALARALQDDVLRGNAAIVNRSRVEDEGRLDTNMAWMEELYLRLVATKQ